MICGTHKYQYYISIDNGASYTRVYLNVYPKITNATVEGEVFYRATSSDWILQRSQSENVYDAVLGFMQNPCTSTLQILVQARDGLNILYTGKLKINNTKVDEIKGVIAISPEPVDNYEWWDKDKDTVINADVTFREVTYLTTSILFEEEIDRIGLPPAMGGMDLCSIATGSPQVYTFGQQRIPFQATGYLRGDGVYGDGYTNLGATNCPTDRYYKAQCTPETIPAETLGNLFIRLDDLIQQLLTAFNTGLTIESTFLNDANNPITGSANQLNNIVLGHVADIVGTQGKNREISFTGLIDIVKKLQCFWWVEGSKLKIEHIKTITDARVAGIDLTAAKYNTSKYLTLKNINGDRTDNEYTFQIEVPLKEEFSYVEGDDRIGTIEYTSGLTDQKTKKHELTGYIADVIKLINFPDSLSDDSYIILVTDNSYQILEETDGSVDLLNYHLSWDKILNNYWIYNRPFNTGLINNVVTAFTDLEKMKVQAELLFPNLDDIYDMDKYITTNMGEGLIQSHELDTGNSFIKVILKQNACS